MSIINNSQTHPINPAAALVRQNKESTCSVDYVLNQLKVRFDKAALLSSKPYTKKNLIYFTVNDDPLYMELLEICVNSLLMNAKGSNFDILIIGSLSNIVMIQDRLRRLRERYRCPWISIYQYIPAINSGQDIKDPVIASMNKLHVFNWQGIRSYGKVLYVDVDIIFIRPIKELFDLRLTPGVLHSTIHTTSDHLHQTIYHRIKEYTHEEMNEFKYRGIHAFNAGQFMFINSYRMKEHFDNIIWLSKVWPAPYFFEQSFMNHYFNGFFISDIQVLLSKFRFLAIHLGERALYLPHSREGNEVALHFTGCPGNAEAKLKFMNQFFSQLINK